jgi:hypothetical protein
MLRVAGAVPVLIPGISATGILWGRRPCGESCVGCGMGFLGSLLDGEGGGETEADESSLW